MALSEENGMVMPVSPMYGNGNGGFGFGGDSWGWIILLLLCANGGMWGGFGGGMWGMDGIYPWMNQANLTSNGFQNQLLNDNITSIRDGVHGISTQLCNGFAGVNQNVSNGFAQAEISNNARQMADMQQMFALQSGVQSGFNATNTGIADLKYTIASEECATRAANTQNTQAVLNKLCQLELDGVKAQVEAKNDRISELQTQLNMANLAASQTAQTAELRTAAQTANANLLSELRSCPIPAQAVYGNQPVFTCQAQNNCGCQGFYN